MRPKNKITGAFITGELGYPCSPYCDSRVDSIKPAQIMDSFTRKENYPRSGCLNTSVCKAWAEYETTLPAWLILVRGLQWPFKYKDQTITLSLWEYFSQWEHIAYDGGNIRKSDLVMLDREEFEQIIGEIQ